MPLVFFVWELWIFCMENENASVNWVKKNSVLQLMRLQLSNFVPSARVCPRFQSILSDMLFGHHNVDLFPFQWFVDFSCVLRNLHLKTFPPFFFRTQGMQHRQTNQKLLLPNFGKISEFLEVFSFFFFSNCSSVHVKRSLGNTSKTCSGIFAPFPRVRQLLLSIIFRFSLSTSHLISSV